MKAFACHAFVDLQGFDKVVPPFDALLEFHGGEGFEEVVPFSKRI